MATVFEKTREEGKIEGKIEGRAEGMIEVWLELGIPKQDILEKLQNKLNISLPKAKEYFNLFEKQV